jgi:hypothetical protein
LKILRFDNVNKHTHILGDQWALLWLISAMLNAGSRGKGQMFPTERGTPQGGPVATYGQDYDGTIVSETPGLNFEPAGE